MLLLRSFCALICFCVLSGAGTPQRVQTGLEVLLRDEPGRLAGRRIGILTNPTGVDADLVSSIDRLRALPGVKVVRLFAPEHGVRGGFAAGEDIASGRDAVSGLPIVSLHGESRRPSAESLAGLDVVVYDIQDIGARSYTFVSTLTYMMEACERAGVAVVVLDRPDPTGGDKIGGPLIEDENLSFIGVHRVPALYGLTPGEWARLIQRERSPKLNLTVVAMRGWRRGMLYGETGLPWVPPSEHIPHWETSLFYAMTGNIGELENVNNGVGTPLPFEQIGTPELEGEKLAVRLNARKLAGVRFRPTVFKPRYGNFAGRFCRGVQIHLTDPAACQPTDVEWALLEELRRVAPGMFNASAPGYAMFRKALGDNGLLRALAGSGGLDAMHERIARERTSYLERRAGILIYR